MGVNVASALAHDGVGRRPSGFRPRPRPGVVNIAPGARPLAAEGVAIAHTPHSVAVPDCGRVLARPVSDAVERLVAGVPLRATIILDAGGRVLYQTPDAERLLALLEIAQDERRTGPSRYAQVPAAVHTAIRALVKAAKGRMTGSPCVVGRTRLGQVTVEASWLAASRSGAGCPGADPSPRPIAVQLELSENAAARAARALQTRGATPAQTRVGVLLATGKSKPEIARTLGVKESSVQDAARKLYTRLGVRNAAELGMQLWLKLDTA